MVRDKDRTFPSEQSRRTDRDSRTRPRLVPRLPTLVPVEGFTVLETVREGFSRAITRRLGTPGIDPPPPVSEVRGVRTRVDV